MGQVHDVLSCQRDCTRLDERWISPPANSAPGFPYYLAVLLSYECERQWHCGARYCSQPTGSGGGPQRRDVTEQIYRQRRQHQKFVVLQPE